MVYIIDSNPYWVSSNPKIKAGCLDSADGEVEWDTEIALNPILVHKAHDVLWRKGGELCTRYVEWRALFIELALR